MMHSVVHDHVGRSGDTEKDIGDTVHSVVKGPLIILSEMIEEELKKVICGGFWKLLA